ncbi:MAG TPA: ATP-binding cassette domain-containing protein [Pseudolysinimonas sp.]|nr:ATP-binding cassette domain-containing protein [Pseudolysinimonas sp.]
MAGVDLAIEPGERVLLLGPSGAGKSTLLAALAGVLGADSDGRSEEGDASGSLSIDGVAPVQARGRVGLVLQDPDGQIVLARVGDEVAFGCENLGVPRDEIWRRVGEALDAVGLDLPLDASTAALSGGQKQRLALASVLAMRPGLILLDEPTANLDPAGVTEVRDAVLRAADRTGATVVVVEHRVGVWAEHVDRVVVLEAGGGVVADGTPSRVLRDRGAELAAQGVWVPGHGPRHPVRDWTAGERLLTASELGVSRGGRVVASGIGLEVDAGRALAITGPNGSGKTTLALTLGGLLKPAAGELRAESALSADPEPIRWRSRALLTRIGTVFQEPEQQFLAPTVRGELEVGPRALRLGDAGVRARVDPLLERLRLAGLADAHPSTLSGGEQRRLSVAAVLASRPRVLVVDEPTFGQDSRTWAELAELFAELLRAGTALVAVTHDAELIDALADATADLTLAVPA